MLKEKTPKFIVLLITAALLLTSLPAFASETEKPKLSLDEAIKKAISNDTKLKNTRLGIKNIEIQRDNLKQSVIYTPIDYNFNPTDTNLFKSYYGLESQIRQTERKLEADKKQLIIDVTKAYYDVLKAQKTLETAKISLAKGLVKHSQVNSKYEVGIATKTDLLSAGAQLATDNSGIKEAEANLHNAFSNLNKLTGQDLDYRPELTDNIEYSPITFDTDIEVLKAINNSYETWSAEEAARTSNIKKYFEYWSDIGINNEAISNNTVGDVKEQIKVQAQILCRGIQNLQAKYQQMDEQIKQMEENLRVLNLQYKLGIITRDVVLIAEISLNQLQNSKAEISSQHAISLLTLKKLTGELSSDV